MEEKKLATWGTDVPDDLVLDEKLLADALKKVNDILSYVYSVFGSHSASYLYPLELIIFFLPITLSTLITKDTTHSI